MDFTTRRKKTVKSEISSISELYPHNLQMYKFPPIGDITLKEFEELAMERLKVLRALEHVNLKGLAKSSEEYKKAVGDELNKELKLFYRLITSKATGGKETDFEARRADHISHFILRLAYCRSENLRRWFIAREVELFRLRWSYLTEKEIVAFIELNHLDYTPISETERKEVENIANGMIIPQVVYYRVVFTQVLDLVRSRSAFLHKGFAYIKNNEIISVLVSLFRNALSHDLIMTSKRLPVIEEDDRIAYMLKDLHHSYTGDDYAVVNTTAKINIQTLDSLSKHSFPLCMRQLHTTLRSLHHLKHGGRMQYGLFLKGIGVTLEDALTFWREEFTKKIDIDKFEKSYSYSIRHNYGQEGKRTNYTPYSCMKIITGSISSGNQHGCPFKHNDLATLRTTLQQCNVPPLGIQEVCELVTKGHYQIACGKYFELMQGVPSEKGINHPNQYFEESQRILNNKTGGAAAKTNKQVSGIPTTSKEAQSPKEEDLWGDASLFESIEACN